MATFEEMQRSMVENRTHALHTYRTMDAGPQGSLQWWTRHTTLSEAQCFTHLHNCNKEKYDRAFARLTRGYTEITDILQEEAADESHPLTEGNYLAIVGTLKELREHLQENADVLTHNACWK